MPGQEGKTQMTAKPTLILFAATTLIAGCATTTSDSADYAPPPSQTTPTPPPTSMAPPLAAQELVLTEWRKSEVKDDCAPASFLKTGQPMNARRADFSGGWAVAFDLPNLRSAYGIAGTGSLDNDGTTEAVRRGEIERWPHVIDLPALPNPSYAGYGLSGFTPYPADNKGGVGLKSGAYLRIGGQKCLYNVWSSISREHLESLLKNIRIIEQR